MFQEYPKWLYPADSAPVLVDSAEDEAQVLAEAQDAPQADPEPAKRGPGRPRKVAQ